MASPLTTDTPLNDLEATFIEKLESHPPNIENIKPVVTKLTTATPAGYLTRAAVRCDIAFFSESLVASYSSSDITPPFARSATVPVHYWGRTC